jgi:hypothetical protein
MKARPRAKELGVIMSNSARFGPLSVAMCLLALFTSACVIAGQAETNVPVLSETPELVNRTNCGEYYGTAFRNNEERDWYLQNCSKWPLTGVPQARPGAQTPGVTLPAECLAMRGKPYESNQARDWYLQNCQVTAVPSPAGGTPSPSSGPDRQNCNEIRGTAYRSNSERAWYSANCLNVPAPTSTSATGGPAAGGPAAGGPAPAATPAERRNCEAIRRGGYRTPAELQWYVQSCLSR